MDDLKYRPWPPGEWAKTLPEHYFLEMGRHVDGVTEHWFSEQDRRDGYDAYVKARYVFGRMEIAQTRLMPWIAASIPNLGEKTILEIGCGNGSATVPLARASRHVHAFDIAADQVEVAKLRCSLLGCSNVTLFSQPTSWIETYAEDPLNIAPPVDVIVCYALFEHLLPIERLKLLQGAWKHLAIGGYLIVIETPNRLYWFDWHSGQMPFSDQLPPELLYLWYDMSPRNNIPKDIRAKTLEEAAKGNIDRLYRFGRGASFHEFYLALGPENFLVTQQDFVDRKEFPGHDDLSIAALERQLAKVSPPPHPAFARPCLDVVLEKTGSARL